MSSPAALLDAGQSIEVDGARIAIRKADLWLNLMPSAGGDGPPGANLTLTVDQQPTSADGPIAPFAPIRLYVLRTADGSSSASVSEEPGSHHSWEPSPPGLAPDAAEAAAVQQGGVFIVRGPGFIQGDDAPRVNAWRGPRWAGENVPFVAVLEFAGGLAVRSGVEQMMVVH